MPNKKISELPAATLPLSGSELMEVVQGGINKQVAKSDVATGGGGTVTSVTGTTNRITSTGGATPVINIDAAYDATIAAKAPLASPTFTGVPAAPTAGSGTNTTQLATTAFVQQENALKSDSLITYRTLTASHTLDATDLASINAGETLNIFMDVATANDLIVPPNSTQAFPVGSVLLVDSIGVGETTLVAGVGVTLNNSDGLEIAGQYAQAGLKKTATDVWTAFGKLKI